MRTDLITRMRGTAPISSIIGQRAYWSKRKANDPVPGLVLNSIGIGLQYTHDGDPGFYGSRIQFDCLGLEVRDFLPLFNAVKAEMERAVTVGGTEFKMSFMISDRDIPFVDVAGIGAVGGIGADFLVWWKSL